MDTPHMGPHKCGLLVFDQGVCKGNSVEKEQFFQQEVLEKPDVHLQERETWRYFVFYIKINSKLIVDQK